MVSPTGDIPDRDDVTPEGKTLEGLLEDFLDSGEIEVTLVDGSTYELHGHDTYVFESMVYTKHGDEDVWFFLSDIVSVSRHYE